MTWVFWTLIALCFIGSLIGVFVPIIPGALLVWIGFLLYQFGLALPGEGLSASFWWGMGVLTVLIFVADLLANLVFVKKYGGSKWGVVASIAGMVIGPFLFAGPIGFILGPIIAVFLVEWIQNKDLGLSAKIAMGTLAAFLGGGLAKVILQLAMMIWFFIAI
ncbi:hypothetical protein BEP19_04730 [Ammoniphilus oxalaticus]|uniref:DUF456 domain-containing protein n=1 Tax=Ammoniphilus oxalaticus TaxID=66863 RepID=A0A419SM91_9BACL|nr:DUF456 family protein [Ammoniphilus oxalaticus]RKD25126.1 hypothetical protein BEP19_04730 [Ammoniphilus oxalaticus]